MSQIVHYGGLKTMRPKKHKNNSFDLVRTMLFSPNAKTKLISFNSLYGFIFRLSVDLSHAQFLDVRNSKFQTPVTEYIIKLSVIADEEDDDLGFFLNHKKTAMTAREFMDEAIFQQSVWLRGIQGGREALSPSVANASILNMKDSETFMYELENNTMDSIDYNDEEADTEKEEAEAFFLFMIGLFTQTQQTSKPMKLGVLTMALKPNARSMESELNRIKLLKLPAIEMTERYAMALSNILRLVLQMKIMHLDLHENNILFYEHVTTTTTTTKCILIDFGRASFLSNGKADEYLTVKQKQHALSIVEKMFDKSLSYNLAHTASSSSSSSSSSFSTKQSQLRFHFVETVLRYIVNLHIQMNKELFEVNENQHQLLWISQIPDKQTCFLLSYQMYLQQIQTINTGLSETTLKNYIREGRIENLDTNRDLRSFYYTSNSNNNSSSSTKKAHKTMRKKAHKTTHT